MSGPVARYDDIAEFYDGRVGDGVADAGTAALLELAGEVSGLRVLDVACGQGRIARELARHGAGVVGIDIAEGLLARARDAERDVPLGIHYLSLDAGGADALAGMTFEGVVCNYGLSDIDDLGGTLNTVARVLEPGGWFVFSILHPCFPGWDTDAPPSWPAAGYRSEGWWMASNSGFRGRVGSNHRMLSTYVNELATRGLVVDRTAEPDPGAGWAERNPGAAPVPVHLVVRCLKR